MNSYSFFLLDIAMLEWIQWNHQYCLNHNLTKDPIPNRQERKQLYKDYKLNYEANNMLVQSANANYTPVFNSLAATPCVQPSPTSSGLNWFKPAKQEQGNNPMNDFYSDTSYKTKAAYASASVVAAPTDAQTKIQYLRERARDIRDVLDRALRVQFKLGVDAGPQTEAELIKAIQDGKFTMDEEKVKKNAKYVKENGYAYGGPLYGIVFTDFPGADKEGFKVAYDAMKAEYQKIKDIINIKDADTALDAVQAFEGWTYDKPTVH